MAIYDDRSFQRGLQNVDDMLTAFGKAEELRQTREATEAIMSSMTTGDPDSINNAITAAANYRTKRTGIMQRIGQSQMTRDPAMDALGKVINIASAQQRARMLQAQELRAQESEKRAVKTDQRAENKVKVDERTAISRNIGYIGDSITDIKSEYQDEFDTWIAGDGGRSFRNDARVKKAYKAQEYMYEQLNAGLPSPMTTPPKQDDFFRGETTGEDPGTDDEQPKDYVSFGGGTQEASPKAKTPTKKAKPAKKGGPSNLTPEQSQELKDADIRSRIDEIYKEANDTLIKQMNEAIKAGQTLSNIISTYDGMKK